MYNFHLFSGEISAFSLDDNNGALNFLFNQSLFIKNGTQFLDHVGAVRQIQCLSLGGVFAVIWDHKVPEEKPHLNGKVNGTSGKRSFYFVDTFLLFLEKPRQIKCPPVLALFR